MREATATIRLRPELEPILRPGDTLIVRVHPDAAQDTVAEIKARLLARFPGIDVAVIAAEQIMIYRPEEVADA